MERMAAEVFLRNFSSVPSDLFDADFFDAALVKVEAHVFKKTLRPLRRSARIRLRLLMAFDDAQPVAVKRCRERLGKAIRSSPGTRRSVRHIRSDHALGAVAFRDELFRASRSPPVVPITRDPVLHIKILALSFTAVGCVKSMQIIFGYSARTLPMRASLFEGFRSWIILPATSSSFSG